MSILGSRSLKVTGDGAGGHSAVQGCQIHDGAAAPGDAVGADPSRVDISSSTQVINSPDQFHLFEGLKTLANHDAFAVQPTALLAGIDVEWRQDRVATLDCLQPKSVQVVRLRRKAANALGRATHAVNANQRRKGPVTGWNQQDAITSDIFESGEPDPPGLVSGEFSDELFLRLERRTGVDIASEQLAKSFWRQGSMDFSYASMLEKSRCQDSSRLSIGFSHLPVEVASRFHQIVPFGLPRPLRALLSGKQVSELPRHSRRRTVVGNGFIGLGPFSSRIWRAVKASDILNR